MGAISPGLGLGTTVYFELPLFSCVSAGKPPLTSSMSDFPPYSPDPPIKDDEELLSTSVSGHSIRMKPRPNRSLGSSSAVLAAGDLHINDTAAAVGSTIQTQSIAHQQLGSSGLELDVIELTYLPSIISIDTLLPPCCFYAQKFRILMKQTCYYQYLALWKIYKFILRNRGRGSHS